MAGMAFPIKVSNTKKCNRCTMHYKKKLHECPHCKDITDGAALDRHIEKHQASLRAHANMGVIFLMVGLAIAVLLAVTLM